MTIRERTEQIQRDTLSPMAALSTNTIGRDYPEEPCPIRTDYQRDRDRVLHCKSFRRLMHKTQVFLSPEGDHYCTRLTHTLEVSQVARTIARALRLNEDLVEAIALGHDLGHSPFGHSGETALNNVCPHGFSHTKQSVRVVERLERGGRGLNLTYEVRNGIACHSSGKEAETFEGKIVRYADKIAYMNHDIDDAVRAGVISPTDIPWNVQYKLGRTKSERLAAFITNIIESSTDDIHLDTEYKGLYDELRSFMFEYVYSSTGSAGVKGEEGKAIRVVTQLYEYFSKNPEKLPEEYRAIQEQEGIARAVCDYISGMTDRYSVLVYESLFIPRSWSIPIFPERVEKIFTKSM